MIMVPQVDLVMLHLPGNITTIPTSAIALWRDLAAAVSPSAAALLLSVVICSVRVFLYRILTKIILLSHSRANGSVRGVMANNVEYGSGVRGEKWSRRDGVWIGGRGWIVLYPM